MKTLACVLILLAGPALASGCPPPPDHDAALDGLLSEVREATSDTQARVIGNQMWELWADAPDEAAQELLDSGMQKRAGYDFLGALSDFDRLIKYCPDYAEGYNQRAFVNFLRQDYARALPDLDEAIARSPKHVAAMAGKALTLMALGRTDEAREVFAAALALNPWLPERGLAAPGGPLAPTGEDI